MLQEQKDRKPRGFWSFCLYRSYDRLVHGIVFVNQEKKLVINRKGSYKGIPLIFLMWS